MEKSSSFFSILPFAALINLSLLRNHEYTSSHKSSNSRPKLEEMLIHGAPQAIEIKHEQRSAALALRSLITLVIRSSSNARNDPSHYKSVDKSKHKAKKKTSARNEHRHEKTGNGRQLGPTWGRGDPKSCGGAWFCRTRRRALSCRCRTAPRRRRGRRRRTPRAPHATAGTAPAWAPCRWGSRPPPPWRRRRRRRPRRPSAASPCPRSRSSAPPWENGSGSGWAQQAYRIAHRGWIWRPIGFMIAGIIRSIDRSRGRKRWRVESPKDRIKSLWNFFPFLNGWTGNPVRWGTRRRFVDFSEVVRRAGGAWKLWNGFLWFEIKNNKLRPLVLISLDVTFFFLVGKFQVKIWNALVFF